MTEDRTKLHPLYLPAMVSMCCLIFLTIWTCAFLEAGTDRYSKQMDVACHQIAPEHRPQVCEEFTR